MVWAPSLFVLELLVFFPQLVSRTRALRLQGGGRMESLGGGLLRGQILGLSVAGGQAVVMGVWVAGPVEAVPLSCPGHARLSNVPH